MEKMMNANMKEKSKFQKQVTRMTKDLTQSYSYIGEINRKLDILENIAIAYPENSNDSTKKQTEIYDSIMGAIQIFGKSDEFSLRFLQKPKMDIIKEIKSFPDLSINFSTKFCRENKCYSDKEGYIVVTSPKTIDNIFSCIVIKKNQSSSHIDDLEMMKTLAAQALFLFVFMRKNKQINSPV